MAITKILARNAGLNQAIQYALNGDKTEHRILTTHQNCDPGREYRQMMNTKSEVGKLDGRQCYAETCKSGSGGGSAETAGESQYGAAASTSHILEANTNYVITDPKSEVLMATGGYLKRQGYDIRVLNLVNLEESDGYNPFRYLRDEKDALRLVNNLIQATTPKGSHNSDPFWEKSETALLQAIILMLFQEAPEYEQNFSMVMRVLEYAEVKEEDEEYDSPLDLLFQSIEREHPDSVAVRQYKVFKLAAGKTAKSILVSTAVRLAPFNLPQIQAITTHDDMDLYTLGEKKCALYAVIPDNDSTFNFLVSLLYGPSVPSPVL